MRAGEGETKEITLRRFTNHEPCPVCGGWDSLSRGKGKRCYGFVSKDGIHAHCTREELAARIKLNRKTNTYPHVLSGSCDCGCRHDGDGQSRWERRTMRK